MHIKITTKYRLLIDMIP